MIHLHRDADARRKVFVHAKDMSLSGRRLNPVIFEQILVSLGVSPTDLANRASPDPAVARQAFNCSQSATLSQEPDGPFDATSHLFQAPPDIPGAYGYDRRLQLGGIADLRSWLLAGFDLNESHLFPLAAEQIDYGDPATTAEDVVDRATLKAFVEEAGNFPCQPPTEHRSGRRRESLHRLRDPTGPWRHGSVYLYVLDRTTDTIVFFTVRSRTDLSFGLWCRTSGMP